MALTAKPIGTISYNTEPHLKRVLDNLLQTKRIEDYRYIKHEGEDGDKDHIHVWLSPNRRLDTAELREMFNEIDNTSDKPLGCLPFRASKGDHWIMYAIHDALYLKSHKSDNDGDGKIEYNLDDIETPYREQLERDYRRAISLRQTDSQKIVDAIEQGKDLVAIAYESDINPAKINAMASLYRIDRIKEEEKNYRTLQEQRIKDLEGDLQEQQLTIEGFMLKDLENRTGEDLHTKKQRSVFDEEE